MPQINILNVLQGDNQSTIVDKLNYNFDQILSAGGGPQGQQGLIGPTGPIGPQGPQGVQGLQGASGTKWFVQNTTAPASGSIYAGNPALYPTIGDYWLDTGSSNEEIWVFGATGWIDTGIGLAAGSIFQNVLPIDSIVGNTTGIFIAGAATNTKSLILSDADINAYLSGGSENENYENSKLKISTEDARQKLISFGRSGFEATGGGTGSAYASYNPSIDWEQSFFTGTGPSYPDSAYFNLAFKNPKGAIGIRSEGNTGGVNIFSKDEVTAESVNKNIILTTAAIDKGIFNNINPNGGFVEISNLPTVTNQPYPTFYANSTGVGIGVGTGQFKMTGTDARKLAVLGNVSISKTLVGHNGGLFLGNPTEIKNDKGVLFVEGHAFFGTTGKDSDPGSLASTGYAESLGIYPQVMMSSLDQGPVLQVRNRAKNYGGPADANARTVIGSGFYDNAAGNISSGQSDITQELFLPTTFYNNISKGSPNPAAISYQHKITDALNTGGDKPPVFSISTFLNSGVGGFTHNTAVNNTTIETKNSNRILQIQANGSIIGTTNQLRLGGSNNYGITVFGQAGTAISPVTIGYVSAAHEGSFNDLSTEATFSKLSPNSIDYARHALSVSGVQTIGTTDPISAFNTYPIASQECVGGVSMLKVHRDLGTVYNYSSGMGGATVNNYPNGIEITSFVNPTVSYTTDANESVALAIGSKRGYIEPKITKGFLVSNNGKNVTINGGCIDPNVHLYIPTATSNEVAITTQGLINVGNVSATEIVRADIDFTTGTGVPGWQYYPSNFGDGIIAGQMPSTDITTFTNWDIWHQGPVISWGQTTSGSGATQNYRRFLKYKILGRTVHLSFMFSQMEFLGSHEGFILNLPAFLRPASGDITYKPRNGSGYPNMRVNSKIQTGRALYSDWNNTNPDNNVYTKELFVEVARVTQLSTNQAWSPTMGGPPYAVNPNLQNFCLVMRSVFRGAATNNINNWVGGYATMVEEGALGGLSRRFYDGTGGFSTAPFWYPNLGYGDLGSYVSGSITYDLD